MARTADIVDYVSPYDALTLSAEVRTEVDKIRMEGQAWSPIRPLQEGDSSSGALSCDGAPGSHHLDCTDKVVAIQYNVQGESQHYCEKHALEQNEWDIVHYRSKPKPVPKLTKEQEEFIAKLLVKKKMKTKSPEPEPLDPMA
jgi:hypothetical protein